MAIDNPDPKTIKDRVDNLEQTLLALNCFSNVLEASTNNNVDVPQGDTSFLLQYLSEESLYKVEAIRMMLEEQEGEPEAEPEPVPRLPLAAV